MGLFSDELIEHLDVGYINLRDGQSKIERQIVETLENMWTQYSDYADPDFRAGFARDPESRFWEMYLGCTLLESGKQLLRTEERQATGGNPDLCVLNNGRRIWIEAIAPGEGDEGGFTLPEGYQRILRHAPTREVQLRISSALWTKTKIIRRYRDCGDIAENDVSIVAVGAAKFGINAGGPGIPLPLSTVFPIGPNFVRLDSTTLEVVDEGYQHSFEIPRENGPNIPRTAFLDTQFQHVAGLIWSRASIGNMNRSQRPLTFVHNPVALKPLEVGWGVWDREYVASKRENEYIVDDILYQTN